MKHLFNISAFENLPTTLKPSDYVDFLLFLANEKPCLRLGYNQSDIYLEMIAWCKAYKMSYVISKAGFMYISKCFPLANIAKIVDDSTISHTYIFGKILGYPSCCSKRIAMIGERNIDDFEKEFVSNSNFQAPYNIINPKGYIDGYSLISHIPCCTTCKRSLAKARVTYNVILKYREHPAFSKWKNHWL